ncbi:DUF1294 domain-containing protein [Empedobacter falsenii]|uniref:DUF1294 domain-containing protein n=1 Tax=Empedobacter falsenii TaxID=343874 RepID=UPI0025764AE9|nr:DUF1294 domain-containing protein [Empedobacter falsenii]MDM1296990.1 DUF1294 domain-containing protein [Empedobacter falsenii]MDM1316783.1 DUF1294 domain-containing protein [Empedobacter falsenii]
MEIPLLLTFILINLLAFFLFKIDKKKAVRGQNRISEITLCSVTLVGGTIGSILAMQIYRHKTKKSSFIFKILIIVAIQVLIIWKLIDNA